MKKKTQKRKPSRKARKRPRKLPLKTPLRKVILKPKNRRNVVIFISIGVVILLCLFVYFLIHYNRGNVAKKNKKVKKPTPTKPDGDKNPEPNENEDGLSLGMKLFVGFVALIILVSVSFVLRALWMKRKTSPGVDEDVFDGAIEAIKQTMESYKIDLYLSDNIRRIEEVYKEMEDELANFIKNARDTLSEEDAKGTAEAMRPHIEEMAKLNQLLNNMKNLYKGNDHARKKELYLKDKDNEDEA